MPSRYSASVGVTTNVDMGAFVIPGLADIQDSFVFDGLASADPFRMYDAFLALAPREEDGGALACLLPQHGHPARDSATE